MTLRCVALAVDPNCTHSNGVGATYTDCDDLLGNYSLALAQKAATAADFIGSAGVMTNGLCGDGYEVWGPIFDLSTGTQTGFNLWVFQGTGAGIVLTVSGTPGDALQNGCDVTGTGEWN